MTTYLYPQNLKATANLWLWGLRDFAILCVAALTLCFGFLTIRMDDATVLDFLKYAVRYFISSQQIYDWR